MNPAMMILLTAFALSAAVYAQMEIPRFTASPHATLLTRAGLAVLGLALGYVLADNMARSGGPALVMFLLGFGSVHLPAAIILFFKRAAGAGKS